MCIPMDIYNHEKEYERRKCIYCSHGLGIANSMVYKIEGKQ